jgi:hypothetical protein
VAQILMGTGDSHYFMCLGCREIAFFSHRDRRRCRP